MANTALSSYIRNKSYRFSYLLGAFLFFLPLGIQAISGILLLIIVIHSLIFLRKEEWLKALSSSVFLASAIFYSIHLLSLLWSDRPAEGLQQLETKLSFLFGPLFILAARERYISDFKIKALKLFMYGCLLATLVILIIATYRTISAGNFYQLNSEGGKQFFFLYTHLSRPLMHPGYLALYLGLGLFAALYLANLLPSKRNKYFFLGILFFAMLILLQARMVLLALLAVAGISILIYVIKTGKTKWLWVSFIPVLLLSAFIFFSSDEFKKRYFQLPDFSYDISGDNFNSATYRLAQWSSAMEVISDQPLIGTGVGDNREALIEVYKEKKFWHGLARRFNAHNQFVETTIAVGLIGLLSLLLMFAVYTRQFIVHRNYSAVIMLWFFAFCLLTESMFERSWAILLFNTFFPLMLLNLKEVEKNEIADLS